MRFILIISLIIIGLKMANAQPAPMPIPEFTEELNNIICIEEGLR
jgi:hypothetical protein